jgi:two-component system, sensor histidine kinase and response regulator
MQTSLKLLSHAGGFVRTIGYHPDLDEYEKRKLSVFNQLNLAGIFCGLFISFVGAFDEQDLPLTALAVAFSPAIISSLVLYLNFKQKHEWAQLTYFILYPVVSSFVYAGGMDVGIELFFILYGVLAVFYMRSLKKGLLVFFISAACYLVVFVFAGKNAYHYQLKQASFLFYALNHVLALVFIFFALFWLKKENNGYQKSILLNNELLTCKNQEIEQQRDVISQKAEELSELNALKNKLFSVISHDLKNPIYALQNLFRQVDKYDVPGDEIKLLVPEILNDLNYTTALMENLLHWAKTQMQSQQVALQRVDVAQLAQDTTKLLRLQAEAKHIYIHNKIEAPVYVQADKDMLNLVIRNLLSNAIKFTPENGSVTIETSDLTQFVEISVSDTGMGMTKDVLKRLSENSFYTTKGTSNETGTGLGLMLCKDFLQKLGSRMYIESEKGKGSVFSFALAKHGDR